MKRTIIILAIILISPLCYCQSLSFRGIPIDGTRASFEEELQKVGFEYIVDDPDSAFHGEFLDELCILKVNDDKGNVNGVTIILMPDDNWPFIYAKYLITKKKLINELGNPTKDEERFSSNPEPQNNADKFEAVNNGECLYQCYWFTPDIGCVSLSKSGENTVVITYLKLNDNWIESIPHIKFKGHSLGGSVDEFVRALEREGYSYLTKMQNYHILSGTFAGYSNCSVYIAASEYSDVVKSVSISFPDQKKWEYLYANYSNIKLMLVTIKK